MCLDVLGMQGEVEEEVWSGGSACWLDRSLVPGDVNPHGNGLGACEADGCAVVVEVGATPLLEGRRGGIEDAETCKEFRCLAVRQDVKQSEEVAADSPRCRHNGGQEEEVTRVVVIHIG